MTTQKKAKQKASQKQSKRNGALVDKWSLVHFATSAALTVVFGPLFALIIVTLWEPFEVLLLSPFLAKYNVVFGQEKLQNSVSDLIFNILGISFAVLFL